MKIWIIKKMTARRHFFSFKLRSRTEQSVCQSYKNQLTVDTRAASCWASLWPLLLSGSTGCVSGLRDIVQRHQAVETAVGCYLFPQSLERCALNRSAHVWAWPPEHLRVHRMEERSLWNKCKLDCKQQHSCARDRLRPPAPERSPREKVLSNFQWLQTVPRVTEILITRSPCGKWGAWSIFIQISLTKVDI